MFWCWHQESQPRVTQEMKARAEVIQGDMLWYCIQRIIRMEITCKVFNNESFILIFLRRQNKCKIISILQIKWSGIFQRFFNTHFLWDVVMGGFQLWILLAVERLLKSNRAAFLGSSSKFSKWSWLSYWMKSSNKSSEWKI